MTRRSSASRDRLIAVCADDFGLSEAGSQAIVDLAGTRSVSAVSCAVDGRYAEWYAGPLARVAQTCSLGLHLNLTENPCTPLNAGRLRWALRSGLDGSSYRASLRREVGRQLQRFEELFQRIPQFVDGHEHVHQLRGVREILIGSLRQRYGGRVAIRSTVPTVWRGLKAAVVARAGGRAMRQLLRRQSISTNRDFAGVYDFSIRRPFELRMHDWLKTLADGGLIMCHPERPRVRSAPRSARELEFAFLSSPRWPQLLQEQRVRLVAFPALPSGHT